MAESADNWQLLYEALAASRREANARQDRLDAQKQFVATGSEMERRAREYLENFLKEE